MKKIFCLIGGFFAVVASVNAQTFTGRVVDEKQQPLEFANVVLLSLPDSAFVAGTISDQSGTFALPDNGRKVVLRISSVGYTTVHKSCSSENVGIVQLLSDTQLLGEVVIKADLPKTRVKGDAMITGVAGTILEKAGTAENLLDKIPNVTSENGTVKVFGRGAAEIYINGRRIRDNSELDQLAADNVKSVEVVNNPGARYDASVKAVIRITTKKVLGDGFGFNNRAYAGYNKKWTLLDQFNFNYRSGGFDLQGMLYGNDGHSWGRKETVQDTYLDKHWTEKSFIDEKEHTQRVNAMLALNYIFNESHSLGIRYNWTRRPEYLNETDMLMEMYKDEERTEQALVPSTNSMQETRHQMNLYYSGRVVGWGIEFNADGLWGKSNQYGSSDETTVYSDGSKECRVVTTRNEVENDLYAGKLVLSHSLLGGELSLGGEYSHAKRTNDYRNPEKILNDEKNQIKEGSSSAFVEYSRSFGSVNMQAGLRFENVSFNYYDDGKRMEEQSKDYSNLFPSLSLSFPIGKMQMLLSYAADITRPSYHQLRGNIVYNDRYTYESGNPLLKPSLSSNVTMGASYKWLQLSAGYQHIKDAIVFTCDAYSPDNPTIALISMVNASAYDNIFASLTLSPTVGIWFPQLGVQLEKQWYTAETPRGRRGLNNPIGVFSLGNTLELPLGFQLDADASWTTCGYSENQQLKKNRWNVDVMLYKSFMKNCLSFQLRGNDLFNTSRTKAVIYYGALRTMSTDIHPSSRSVSLTVRYKFNSAKSKYRGTGAGESQKSRM